MKEVALGFVEAVTVTVFVVVLALLAGFLGHALVDLFLLGWASWR